MPYAPKIGGQLAVEFPGQFPKAVISSYSFATTLVELLANDGSDTSISHATGFLWRSAERIWLISARHVFSGTSPFDGSLMSPATGFIPNRIRVYPTLRDEIHTWRVSLEIELRQTDGSPAWLQDPDFEKLKTDIAALPLPVDPSQVMCMNDDPDWGRSISVDLLTHIGFPCTIIGYPTRNVSGLMTPIWRTGSIASEPALPVDGKPMFLIDAATGPGFSGSAVFRMHVGPAPYHDAGQPGGIRIESDAVVRSLFVGVYAGRLSHSHFGGEVPFVFYGNRIPVILGQ